METNMISAIPNQNNIYWLTNNSEYRLSEENLQSISELPKAVYTIVYDNRKSEYYLKKFAEKFEFNFKIYDLETELIDHIMKTFHNTNKNLGMLFSGKKGTGKTVTAKILANKMNLPVIIINNFEDEELIQFLIDINTECVYLFDEFDKNFDISNKSCAKLLAFMDGVYLNNKRRIFILTSNSDELNRNMESRPSRIRYSVNFDNISLEIVTKYLEENLLYKEFTNDIIEFINQSDIVTIDTLKEIVTEVNIHNKSIKEFGSIFNVCSGDYSYVCFYSFAYTDKEYTLEEFKKDIEEYKRTKDLNNKLYQQNIVLSNSILEYQKGDKLNSFFGKIITPINKDGFLISTDSSETYLIYILNPDFKPNLF